MSWWLFGIVMVIAGIFRFVNFSNRWVLNQDQARDAVIGIYGSRNGLWPEIGSPSSAGPFNFGPWYHWLIMVWQKIIPTVDGPWIGFSLMTLMTVILLGLVGKKYFGNKGLFIFGLMAAVAVGQVENAPDMLNTVIVGFFSALALWSGSKFVDEDKWRWGVLCGLSVGWAINSHFQSWGLLSLPLAIAVVNKYSLLRRLKMGLTMATGWILAFLPLIWFDVKHNWIWIKSVIEYYTVGVNKFYVPVRWLTEIRDFWPQLFGAVTVGENWFGYIWMGLGMILVIKLLIKSYQSKKYKVNKFWIILVLSLLIQVLLMRMYKGVRSREYLIVFHGYILLMCSFIVVQIYDWKKLLGIGLMGIVAILAINSDIKIITSRPSQAKLIEEINRTIGGDKINVFNYKESNMVAMPIFYLRYSDNQIGGERKVGFCDGSRYLCPAKAKWVFKNYSVYEGIKMDDFEEITAKKTYEVLMVNYGDKK